LIFVEHLQRLVGVTFGVFRAGSQSSAAANHAQLQRGGGGEKGVVWLQATDVHLADPGLLRLKNQSLEKAASAFCAFAHKGTDR